MLGVGVGRAAGRRRRNLTWIWISQHLNGTSQKGCLYAKLPLEQVWVPGQVDGECWDRFHLIIPEIGILSSGNQVSEFLLPFNHFVPDMFGSRTSWSSGRYISTFRFPKDMHIFREPGTVLIRWPINRSNRFCNFLRLDRLDQFGKIIKSIFSKFWKREFQFFWISRISSDFWSFGKNVFSCI